MMRIVLQYLLPLILPSLGYLLWVSWAAHKAEKTGGPMPEPLSKGPWFRLVLMGFVLMVLGLVALTMSGSMDPDGTFRSPRWEDGKIVPGGMEPKAPAP